MTKLFGREILAGSSTLGMCFQAFREDNCWLQPNQQAVSTLPLGEIPHHVHTRGRHPQQEEGDLHPVHAPGQADLGQEEEEKETIVLVNFHFLHFYFLQCFVILIIFAHFCFCLTSGNMKAVLAINNMLQVV